MANGGRAAGAEGKKEARDISKVVLGYDLYVNTQNTNISRFALLIMTMNKTKPEGQTTNMLTIF